MSINENIARCDCCGKSYTAPEEKCSNCGYPVDIKKEGIFLRSFINNLQRVAFYDGGSLTVLELLQRYRQRVTYLDLVEQQSQMQSSQSTLQSDLAPVSSQATGIAPLPTPIRVQIPDALTEVHQPSTPVTPKPAFSLHTFFADQSINIVAALGAFLILVSSLSFVATEPNTLLAFLVLLVVHAFFGLTGAFTFRFPSIRLVSVIYTAIFALQVPLVGFAFYELVSTKFLQISPAALVASVALYAMIAYSALAIYQHFKPFGYFAAVALAVADLATSSAFHFTVGWWLCSIMLLAFPLLLFVPRHSQTPMSNRAWDILRDPARILMYLCVYSSCMFAACTFTVSQFTSIMSTVLSISDVAGFSFDLCLSFAILSVCLLVWICCFIWRVRRYTSAQLVPYLLFITLCLWLYTYRSQITGYIIVFTLLEICYWVLIQRMPHFSWTVKAVIKHLEFIVIALAILVALLSDPLIILQMFARNYGLFSFSGVQSPSGQWLPLDLIAIVIGSLLVFGISINHVGWHKVPATGQRTWCWLVLLVGLLLHYAYTIVLLWSITSLLWGMFAFALLCVGATYVVRRLTALDWAYPLALLSFWIAIESLLFAFGASANNLTLILLGYVFSAYFLATYLRQHAWLSIAVVFAILSLIFVWQVPQALFALNIISSILIILFYRWRKSHPVVVGIQSATVDAWLLRHRYAWPAFFIGLLYALAFILHELNTDVSTLSLWRAVPDAFALEMAFLAVLWYVAAVMAQKKWLLVISTIFAGIALQFPALPFWLLAGLALGLIISAVVIRSRVGSDWTLPFYLLALLAAVMMDRDGSSTGSSLVAAWMLLLFAGCTYLAGVIFEKDKHIQLGLLWSCAVLTGWSLFVVSLSGDFYRLPLFTLAFACIGVGMHSIRHHVAEKSYSVRRLELFQILPIYTISCFAALLTGMNGVSYGVNVPFYGAVPGVLFVYAFIAYGIALFERKAHGFGLVVVFAVWSMWLLVALVPHVSAVSLPMLHQVDFATQLLLVLYSLASVACVCWALGMLSTRLVIHWIPAQLARTSQWVWYGLTLVAVSITCVWCEAYWTLLPHMPMLGMLILFVALALVVMLVERIHELIVLVSLLSIWTIAHLDVPLWLKLGYCGAYFVCVFASQFIWSHLPPSRNAQFSTRLAQWVALGGQFLVMIAAILSGGLSASNWPLTHSGAGSLLIFTLLILWFGMQQGPGIQRQRTFYVAGLFVSFVVTWELLAFALTDFSLLCASPAVYLIVIAPFITRDEVLPESSVLGQICSCAGAILLLGPTLWSSFNHNNVAPSFLLTGEAIALLLLGFITRVRFFVLSATALIIVATIHLLFLPSLGIPTFLALFLTGAFLIILATALLFIRSRLTTFWSRAV